MIVAINTGIVNLMARPYGVEYSNFKVSAKAVFAEFVAMALFVFIGCGTAVFFSTLPASAANVDTLSTQDLLLSFKTYGNWGVITALAFGMAIMFLVYTIAHISGGQINCCVTWGLMLAGHLGPMQGICNFIGQLLGSLLGAGLLYGVVPDAANSTLGSNSISPGFTTGQAVLGEAVMTFTLMFTVLMTAAWQKSIAQNIAPFAIGMAVFAGHAVLLSVDGCSINPTRSFGPAVVSQTFTDFWVFWVGPFVGATLAVVVYLIFRSPYDTVSNKDAEALEPEVNFKAHKELGNSPSSLASNEHMGPNAAEMRA